MLLTIINVPTRLVPKEANLIKSIGHRRDLRTLGEHLDRLSSIIPQPTYTESTLNGSFVSVLKPFTRPCRTPTLYSGRPFWGITTSRLNIDVTFSFV